ncbi:alpha/beta hydrolase family protein [Arthrobacter sp. KN11-1C]|uniref:alpha/beta hydrolase family protein n=1 Tax=Arthrobacter TaxID=1663 RepID=UPI0009914666|nr:MULTISPECIES: alpha/beta fold hydrolase [Arthrobacter]MCI0142486.1 alpha/beta hydrolase [Arthrobacter bambusae]OOP63903.1 osmotically inducible protein OsmC [Arthrobacter sp. SRS-W-1-2016]UYY82530.1 alpha/beta hydrolase [Arthrobacter sp. YA7-1]
MSKSMKISFEGSTGDLLAGIVDVPEGPVRGWGVFSHGLTLGKDSPSASRICKGLADLGVGMLRFDNLGLGDSAGEWSAGSFSVKVADTIRAAEFMRADDKEISLLVGHSFGGAAVLAAALGLPEVRAVATVGAPFEPKHVEHMFDAEVSTILSEGSAEVNLGGRRMEVRRHFVEDVEQADLRDCIRTLHRPLMVLHSPTDNTVGIDNASEIFQTARHPRSFVSLEGSDHLLTGKGQAARVARIISAWAGQYLGD